MEPAAKTEHTHDGDIRRRLFQNSGIMLICRIVTAATSLIAIPFIVGKITYYGFGSWEAITSIASLCSIVPTAVTQTLLWKTSEAYGTQDFDGIRRLIRIGIVVILGLACFIVPPIIHFRSNIIHGIHIPPQHIRQAYIVLPCVVGLSVFGALNDLLGVTIQGCQRTGTVTIIQAIALFVNYVTAITLIRLDYALQGLVVGLALGSLLTTAMYYTVASRLIGGISVIPAIPKLSELKMIGRYGSLLMVGFSSAALRDQTDKLVLAKFASVKWAGYYGAGARLASLVVETSRFFYYPLLTAAASMHASKNWEGVRKLYTDMVVIVGIAAGLITIVVASLNERIQVLWLGKAEPNVTLIILILVVGNATALILTGPGTAICRAIGKVWVETTYVTISLIANLILTITLVLTIGPIGTVIASGSTWAFSAIVFTIIFPKVVDMPKNATNNSRWILAAVTGTTIITYFVTSLLPGATTRLGAFVSLVPLIIVYGALFIGLSLVTRLIPTTALQSIRQRLARGRA